MTAPHRHTIHRDRHHLGWDRSLPPVHHVAPGDELTFEILEASGGQLTPQSNVEDVAALDTTRANPVTGPVYVEGAAPGDALVVTLLAFDPSGWGWTANIPGFGLLADDFPDPAIHIWKYDPMLSRPAVFGSHAHVPLRPMTGTIGVAPATPGPHDIIPPYRTGGNMDIKDLSVGTELFLPVEVEGAVFSMGDTHAAQGDGEVCGTGIESPMQVTVRFDLVKEAAPAFPRFRAPVTEHQPLTGTTWEVTTGIGDDLMQCARNAVRSMIDLLAAEHGLRPVDAYLLCSVCADLRISEIVDAPHWVVSLYFPRGVLD